MRNKEKGLFTGFGSVFSFTAEQNMKGKGFKLSSILIGLLVMVVCAAIPVIMAVVQKPDGSGEDNYNIEENIGGDDIEEEKLMDAIVVVNDVTELCLIYVSSVEDIVEGFTLICIIVVNTT